MLRKNEIIIARNALSLFFREFFNKGALLIILIFVGRCLGKSGLGQYALALIICRLLFLVTDLGLSTLMVREIAKDKTQAGKYFFNLGILRLILGGVSLALIVLMVQILNYEKDFAYVIYLCGVSYFFVSLINFCGAVFQGFEKMGYETVVSLPKNILLVSLGIGILQMGFGLMTLFNMFILVNIFSLLFSLSLCLYKFIRPAWELDITFCKEYLRKTMPLWLSYLFVTTYLYVDSIMLSVMKGKEVVGLYNAAYPVVDFFLIGTAVLLGALFPALSRLYIVSKDSLWDIYEKSFRFLLFIFFPLSIGLMMIADKFIFIVYGKDFVSSGIALKILVWGAFLAVFSALNGNLIVAIGRQKFIAYITGVGVLINVILNMLLIPGLSFVGASVATVITEIAMLTSSVLIVFKFSYKISLPKSLLKSCIKPITAGLVMGVFLYLFRDFNLLIIVAIALVVYLIIVYFTKGFIWEGKVYMRVK